MMSRGIRRVGRIEYVLALGVLDFSLEQSAIVPGLPTIVADYGTTTTGAIWVVTAFLLAAAVAAPVAGRLGDRYSRRRVLESSLALFLLGSVVCALANSIELLIAGRVVQGLGAGVGPLAVSIIRETVAPARVPTAIGLVIGAGAFGGVLGLLGGALLIDHASLSAIFWVMTAVAAVLWAAVRWAVPQSGARSDAPVDWIGAVLLGTCLAATVLAIAQGNAWDWDSPEVLGLFAGGAVLGACFAIRLRTAAVPLLDPRGLGRRPIWTAQISLLAVAIASSFAYSVLPFFAALPEVTGYGLGLSATEIGLVLVPNALAALAGGALGGRLVLRVGARAQVLVGIACVALTHALLVVDHGSAEVVALAMVPLGFGVGLAIGAIVDVVALGSDVTRVGGMLGFNSVVRTVGIAAGTQAAVAIVIAADELAPGVPLEAGFESAFVAGLIASLIAAVVALLIPRRADDGVSAAVAAGLGVAPVR